MKKNVVIILIFVLVMTITFTGCLDEFEEKNYIAVTVNCSVRVVVERGDPDIGVNIENLEGVEVKIDMVKAGGETKTFYRTTSGTTGYTAPVEGTFNLYKEQPITVYARVWTYPEGYENITFPVKSRTWTWDQIYPEMADFGGSTTLYGDLYINGI